MLYWTVAFLILVLFASLLGFGVLAAAVSGVAKVLFLTALAALLAGVVLQLTWRRS